MGCWRLLLFSDSGVTSSPVQRWEANGSKEESQIEASAAWLATVTLCFLPLLLLFLHIFINLQLFQTNIRQIEMNALFDDRVDSVYVSLVLKVDRVGAGTRGCAARIDVESWKVFQKLVECFLLEFVLFSQADQLVSAKLADLRTL